jgi:low molecular weight protein-tyrosine phosphatase
MGTPRQLFRILFVCTGNICRSPIAERLMTDGLSRRLGPAAGAFRVESAGTWGHEGSPMEPYALQILSERGIQAGDFAGRELTAEHVLTADLILTATRDHLDQVLGLDTYAAGRTFPLCEFARLVRVVDQGGLSTDPVQRAQALVDAADGLRRRLPIHGPYGPYDDDIEDPLGAPLHVYRLCAARITDAVGTILDGIAVGEARRVV